MAEIELRNIGKRFADGTIAVQDISLTIEDGELFVLLGPSGCGKSTLLNMIVGLESVSTGEVRMDGRPINHLDPRQRNMAMVFQSYAIYPHMTVQENLAFPLKLAGMPHREIQRRVKTAAQTLELEKLLQRMPRSLSGGQRQRVAMGRAMVRKPAVFLMDEPLSNLDAKLRNQMRNEIARLQEVLKTTMVYVTHDQIEALTLGHRLAVLNKGELQQIGTPQQLYNDPANLFVAGFLGSPAMNFFPGRVADGKLCLPAMTGAIELPGIGGTGDAGEVIVGLRPEHLQLAADGDAQPLMQATISMVEWQGADAFITFDLAEKAEERRSPLPEGLQWRMAREGKLQGIIRLEPSHHFSRGAHLRLQLQTDKLHIFAMRTGNCLNRR